MPKVCWTCLWVRLCAAGLRCDLHGKLVDSENVCKDHIEMEESDD